MRTFNTIVIEVSVTLFFPNSHKVTNFFEPLKVPSTFGLSYNWIKRKQMSKIIKILVKFVSICMR